jgi:hypothetical protein
LNNKDVLNFPMMNLLTHTFGMMAPAGAALNLPLQTAQTNSSNHEEQQTVSHATLEPVVADAAD